MHKHTKLNDVAQACKKKNNNKKKDAVALTTYRFMEATGEGVANIESLHSQRDLSKKKTTRKKGGKKNLSLSFFDFLSCACASAFLFVLL